MFGVVHDVPTQAARLETAVVTILHSAPVQVARLQSAVVTILHQGSAVSGDSQRLLGQDAVDRPGLLGSFARRSRLQS